MKYVAFDLEIAKEVPDGEDLKDHRPLGITCAATVTESGLAQLWHGDYAPKMSPAQVMRLIKYLVNQYEDNGRFPLTWNGLGFDFDIMAEEAFYESGADACKYLAENHIDPGFQMVCERGFMIGLNTAAKGMGLSGKTEGMHGALAPVMWKQGREAQDRVLEYVKQDAITTAEVYEAIVNTKALYWTARSGNNAAWYPKLEDGLSRMLTCAEAMELPEVSVRPGSSFKPWDRNRFWGWLNATPMK